MQRWIIHVDMDAFFASVEQLDKPSLRGLPVIVGGNSLRGVVSAASYEARKFGVRSAMPIVTAKRLCPQGNFVPGRMARYAELSRQVMAVLDNFSPVVEQASIDEAFLDASGLERVFGPVEQLARSLKQRVREETGLVCSVGVAPVKFLAKIASDMEKPDGLTIITPESVPELLASLPIENIPGVGKKTLPAIRSLGIRYAADITRFPREFWLRRFGKMGGILFDRACGKDEREVTPVVEAKSESAENTFEEDTLDHEILASWLLRQSERVGRSLRKQNFAGRTVTLKVKYSDFTTVTRAKTLPSPTNVTRVIFDAALALLDELAPRNKLRLIGVGVSHFGGRGEGEKAVRQVQLSLFGEKPKREKSDAGKGEEKEQALDAIMDAVRDRFGNASVMRARLLQNEPEKPLSGKEDGRRK